MTASAVSVGVPVVSAAEIERAMTPADAVALLLFAAVLAGVYLGNAYIPIGIRVG